MATDAPNQQRRRDDEDCCGRVQLEDGRYVDVRLAFNERRKLELTDDQVRDLLPTALVRHAGVRDGSSRTWDEPVRLYADHFRG